MRVEVDGIDLTELVEAAARSTPDELRGGLIGSDDPALSPDAARWTPEDDG